MPKPGGRGSIDFVVRRKGRRLTVEGPDPAQNPWSIVRRADEKGGGSASTTVATSASVTLTLPDIKTAVSDSLPDAVFTVARKET